jgi:hypothetical protein
MKVCRFEPNVRSFLLFKNQAASSEAIKYGWDWRRENLPTTLFSFWPYRPRRPHPRRYIKCRPLRIIQEKRVMDSGRHSNLSHHPHQCHRTRNTRPSTSSPEDMILKWHFVNLLLYHRIQAALQARLLEFRPTRRPFIERNMARSKIHIKFHVAKYRMPNLRARVSSGSHHYNVHRKRLPHRNVGTIEAGEWTLEDFWRTLRLNESCLDEKAALASFGGKSRNPEKRAGYKSDRLVHLILEIPYHHVQILTHDLS